MALNPLNVIKVRLQKQHTIESNRSSTVRTVVRDIFQSKNIVKTLWLGSSSGLMMSVPNTVMYMVAYEKCKLSMANVVSDRFLPAIAGASARAFAVTMISPIELVRTMQTGGIEGGAVKILKEVVQKQGLTGLYRGWTSTILRDSPFSAIYWFSVESMRPIFQRYYNRSMLGEVKYDSEKFHPTVTFIAGAVSGMISAVATHPFDVVKTHKQLSTVEHLNGKVGIWSIYNIHGIKGLYRGLSIRLFTVIPASAIMITIYESLK
jgi:solute carrier family 25 protein 39/40